MKKEIRKRSEKHQRQETESIGKSGVTKFEIEEIEVTSIPSVRMSAKPVQQPPPPPPPTPTPPGQ
jgi:hypothetical protein